jgi:hypothetical protein
VNLPYFLVSLKCHLLLLLVDVASSLGLWVPRVLLVEGQDGVHALGA